MIRSFFSGNTSNAKPPVSFSLLAPSCTVHFVSIFNLLCRLNLLASSADPLMDMESLPIEILQQICFACDFKTAKNLRCSSRVFDQLAARVIFRDVYVATVDESMTKMLKIAEHPVLRCYVHKLWFLNAVLDEAYTDYEIWEKAVDLSKKLVVSSERFNQIICCETLKILFEGDDSAGSEWPFFRHLLVTPERLKHYHERFVSLFWAQNAFLESNVGKTTLRSAMAGFTNLREIKLYDGDDDLATSRRQDTYEAFKAQSQQCTPFITRLHRETLISHPFALSERERRYVESDYPMDAESMFRILRSLGAMEHKVQVIDLGWVPWSSWHQSASPIYWPRYHHYIKDPFHGIQRMKIKFALLPLSDDDTVQQSVPHQISRFLSSATSLKIADLDFFNGPIPLDTEAFQDPVHSWEHSWVADISSIFQRVHWPKLRELQVRRCGLTERAFISFLKRHSGHLKILHVATLNLVKPTTGTGADVATSNWQRAIQTIAPCMSLDAVTVEHLQDDFQKACNYIAIEEYDKFPFTSGSWEALVRWEEHGRRISDYLRRRGSGPYPQWYDQDLHTEKWQLKGIDRHHWGHLKYRLATLRLT